MKIFLLSIILSLWLAVSWGHLHGQAENSSTFRNNRSSKHPTAVVTPPHASFQ